MCLSEDFSLCIFIVVCTACCMPNWRRASHGTSSPVCDPSSWYIHPIKYLIIIAYIHIRKAEKNVITMVIESIQPFEC